MFQWFRRKKNRTEDLSLGRIVLYGEITGQEKRLSAKTRMEHLGVLGKTGSGKSSLLKWLCSTDIRQGRGFVYFDLHGDATRFILGRVALEEQRKRSDLSKRLIIVDPSDPEWAVGMNILQGA